MYVIDLVSATSHRAARLISTAIIAALAMSVAGLAQDKPADLKSLRSSFESQLDKITRTAEVSSTNLQSQYARSLATLEKTLQEQGKLDPLLVVKKERERYTAERKVDAAQVSADVKELAAIQMNYLKAVEAVPLKKARDTASVAEAYAKSLTTVQEKLTRAGNLDAAIEVKKEREAIENRPEVSAARFTIAEADAYKPPEEEKPAATDKPPATTATTQPPKKLTAAPKKKYTGKPDNYIKKRFESFCKAVLDQDMDGAVEYIDPRIVKERGAEAVRNRLAFAYPFLRILTERPGTKFDAGDVRVDDKEESAMVVPRVWVDNRWHDMQASRWVLVEDDWYAAIEDGGHGGGGDGPRPHPPRGPRH